MSTTTGLNMALWTARKEAAACRQHYLDQFPWTTLEDRQKVADLDEEPDPETLEKVFKEVECPYRVTRTLICDCCNTHVEECVMLIPAKDVEATRCVYVCAKCLLAAMILIEP